LNDLQHKLFETVRQRARSQKHWIDEVAEVLSKSKHAIYKKIQGETLLSLEEAIKLATHYELHLDPLIRPDTVLSFEFPFQNACTSYQEYLRQIQAQIEMAQRLPDLHIWHTGIELPFIHDHAFPDLVAFKYFIYRKTVWADASYPGEQFDLAASMKDQRFHTLLMDILRKYYQFPSTEIWNSMMLDITLSQVIFSLHSRMFVYPEDALILCSRLKEFLEHMESMAEYGIKYVPGETKGAGFVLYLNEIAHSINVVLLKSSSGDMLYLGFANPQFMYTHTGPATKNIDRWLQILRSNATPLVRESRKERLAFFASLHKKVERTRIEAEAILQMQAL